VYVLQFAIEIFDDSFSATVKSLPAFIQTISILLIIFGKRTISNPIYQPGCLAERNRKYRKLAERSSNEGMLQASRLQILPSIFFKRPESYRLIKSFFPCLRLLPFLSRRL